MVSSKQSQQAIRSSTEMFPLIREWERSNLKQKEFCARYGIKPPIFWYWLRRYRDSEQPLGKESKGFIPIKVERVVTEAVFAEIIYSDGTRLIFRDRVEVKFLQQLLLKV